MYKVRPEDEIKRFRTQAQAVALDKKKGGLSGGDPKNKTKKNLKIAKRFNKLIKQVKQSNLIEIVELAHKLVDLGNTKSAKNSVCIKGCAHCCKVNVDITVAEVCYIEIKTGIMVSESNYNLPAESPKIDYCPLLNRDTGLCNVYEYRPISCRSFFAFDDVKFCEDSGTSHRITGVQGQPNSKQLQDILHGICSDENGKQFGDIRNYFK